MFNAAPRGAGFDLDAVAHFAAMSDTSNPVLLIQLNLLIKRLKVAGVWDICDDIFVLHDNLADTYLGLKGVKTASSYAGVTYTSTGLLVAKGGYNGIRSGVYVNDVGNYVAGDCHIMVKRETRSGGTQPFHVIAGTKNYDATQPNFLWGFSELIDTGTLEPTSYYMYYGRSAVSPYALPIFDEDLASPVVDQMFVFNQRSNAYTDMKVTVDGLAKPNLIVPANPQTGFNLLSGMPIMIGNWAVSNSSGTAFGGVNLLNYDCKYSAWSVGGSLTDAQTVALTDAVSMFTSQVYGI